MTTWRCPVGSARPNSARLCFVPWDQLFRFAPEHDNRHPPRLSVQKTNAPRVSSCCDINPADEVGVNSPKTEAHTLSSSLRKLTPVSVSGAARDAKVSDFTSPFVARQHVRWCLERRNQLFGQVDEVVPTFSMKTKLRDPADCGCLLGDSLACQKFCGFRFLKKTCSHPHCFFKCFKSCSFISRTLCFLFKGPQSAPEPQIWNLELYFHLCGCDFICIVGSFVSSWTDWSGVFHVAFRNLKCSFKPS